MHQSHKKLIENLKERRNRFDTPTFKIRDQIQSAPMSGCPPSDPQADEALVFAPFLPCFLSFLPFLDSTIRLLTQ